MLIYKATLPNGKSYIGQTVRSLEKRKKDHFNKSSKRINLFYSAIKKYKWENIKWEILEDNITDINVLNERETFNILKYNTFTPNGYNMDCGGTGTVGYKHTQATKELISKINKGRVISDLTRAKQSFNTSGNKNPFYGKQHSLEVKQKISNLHKGRKFSEEHSKKLSQKISERNKKNFKKVCYICNKVFEGKLKQHYCSKRCYRIDFNYKRKLQRNKK